MADTLGSLAKAAFRKDRGLYGAGPAIAYPQTPGGSDIGATQQIPFTQEGISKGIDRTKDPSLTGSQGIPAAPVIFEPVAGPLTGRCRWSGLERFFCYALGFELPNGDNGSPKLFGTGEGTVNIDDATNATPIVVTTSSSHGYSDGDGVRIASVGGNTAANGDWSIASASGSTLTLVDSSGNGAYTSGGTAEKYNAAAHIFEGDETIQDQAWTTADGRNAGFDANDRKVRRGQFGFDKTVSDWVHSSCFINKFTLAGNPQEMTLTVDLIGYDRVRGSYNSGAWTLNAGSQAQVLFRQLEVSLGSRAAGEGSLATVRPSSFELSVDNKLKADDQTTESGTGIEIPVRDGFRETKLKLEFPRYNVDTNQAAFDADTELAAKLVFTGPVIPSTGSETYLWGFFMSSLRFDTSAVNISGPGRLPESMELYAERPVTTDIFAAGNYNSVALKHDSELVVKIQNEEFLNYLTEY